MVTICYHPVIMGEFHRKYFSLFFLRFWWNFGIICKIKKKNKIVVEFFKISPVVFEIKAFLWWKIEFLPKKAQILGTYNLTHQCMQNLFFLATCSSNQYKVTLGSFFWISIPIFFYNLLCWKVFSNG